MERRMTANEKDMLQRIYAPTVVGVPPGDARRHLCILKDGEIRAYEMRHTLSPADGNAPPLAYLSSRDGGISWKRQYAKGKIGPCKERPRSASAISFYSVIPRASRTDFSSVRWQKQRNKKEKIPPAGGGFSLFSLDKRPLV